MIDIDMVYSIANYMRKDFATVYVGDSAFETSKVMMEKSLGYAIVLDEGKPVGIVTERDLVLKVMAQGKNPSSVKASEIMSTPLITIDPDASLEEAVKIMVKNGIRRLAVVRGGIIYGMFTARDLARHFNEYEDRLTRDIIRSMSSISLPF